MKLIKAASAKKTLLMAAVAVMLFAAMTLARTRDKVSRTILGFTPEQMQWFTPSYYKDGRQRARLLGDSSWGGAW